MRIPYYMPDFNAGIQIINLGEGGPKSHMGLLAMQPRSYPTVYAVGNKGLGPMPRQVLGVTAPVTANNLSNPQTFNNLVINGLMKSPVGG